MRWRVTHHLVVISLAFAGVLALQGCRGGSEEHAAAPAPAAAKPPKVAVAPSEWSNVIRANTSGLVSRRSPVRIQFAADTVAPERVGQPAPGMLTLEPAVAGQVSFTSPRELTLVPAEPLKPGQYYKAVLKNDKLAGVPASLDKYEFFFRVIERQFEVSLEGLHSAQPAGAMLLKGTLRTSDEESGADVEKLLAATMPESKLALAWQHDAGGRTHEFTVTGVKRGAQGVPLTLQWDGKPIGMETQGKTQVDVPALDDFRATAVQLAEGEKPSIALQFSDDLARDQDLRGLISLSSGNFTLRTQGSQVLLYPEKLAGEELQIFVRPGVRSASGATLAAQAQFSLALPSEKPKVRFVGKGVILPGDAALTVPFEAVNARSVNVTAFRIYAGNMGNFLQGNGLSGDNELGRVGRYLWRKRVQLPPAEANRWMRHHLDVSSLFKEHPDGMFRITLSLARADASVTCARGSAEAAVEPPPPASAEDHDRVNSSGWDFVDENYSEDGSNAQWEERQDPCKNAYYVHDGNARDARNFLASNIGLLAKADALGRVIVAATSLRSATPLADTQLSVMNYQNQLMATARTGTDGMATIEMKGKPFYLVAEKDGGRGYLKLSDGAALPISHLDVGGEAVQGGLKGLIYGERGVWRPGDDIHLFFLLQDQQRALPTTHPATMELIDPRGRVMVKRTSAAPVGGFYRFTMGTAPDAPTGDWKARVTLGSSQFVKTVKVESVMPNRLKVELDLGGEGVKRADEPLRGTLSSQWLTGASAGGLKADVKARFSPMATQFDRYADFAFDDPTRKFTSEPVTVFEGKLDDKGNARINHELAGEQKAAGMLRGRFTSRVFERGGAFSVSQTSQPFSPYARYVGVKLPKGDAARNMLITDTPHTVEVASLDWQGKPASAKDVEVSLHKLEWKWWWDQSGGSEANFTSSQHGFQVQSDNVATRDGKGEWKFTVKYPEWGRFLVRACDKESGHCTGKVFYIDWPGWAGRQQEQSGPGASVLTFQSDKPKYKVGEIARITLPEASQGRALVTVESGSRVLSNQWVEFDGKRRHIDVPVTAAMAPNVYVGVTLVQPHAGKNNDRPIRLYGAIPIAVQDPGTVLEPKVQTEAVWVPESKAVIQVSEGQGRAMNYTVAVVDEGLLGLTGYKTPDPHAHFNQREALGVRTWDLFDEVAGAYGGKLERVLAIGGSDDSAVDDDVQRKRFPPVVTVLGPFRLEAKATAKHEIVLPPYIGAVRVMVVAAANTTERNAYGAAAKEVPVRQPLMLLPTVPRIVGPGEEITVPVSVFALEPDVKNVKLKIETDSAFTVVGSPEVMVDFARPEEKLALLKLKAGPRPGNGVLQFSAVSGKHRAQARVDLAVRSPNPPTTEVQRKVIEPGESWKAELRPHGLPGTNEYRVEMSAVPPLELERRLQYLIRYPHGCLEQTTSAALPQLYLPALVQMPEDTRKNVEGNVRAGIDKLRQFQGGSGGFVYWPGAYNSPYNSWTTSYVGHFLTEARRMGYAVPATMMADWVKYQRGAARSWNGDKAGALDQSYRLFTLAQAGSAEVSAMNRLRETPGLPELARWQLAAAYQLAGIEDVARQLSSGKLPAADPAKDERTPDATFGSALRDRAMLLQATVILKQSKAAESLAQEVSGMLASDQWQHTHALAFGLMAMARYVGDGQAGAFEFAQQLGQGASAAMKSDKPVYTARLAQAGESATTLGLKNTGARRLYAAVLAQGVPAAGSETAASEGLTLEIAYVDERSGETIDPARLRQGQDVRATVTIANTGKAPISNIALTQMLPAGWEIRSERLTEEAAATPATGTTKPKPGAAKRVVAVMDFEDIRDDRVLRYFGLAAGEKRSFQTLLNAAYLGRYYQPALTAEAMYDASRHARLKGNWVEVATK